MAWSPRWWNWCAKCAAGTQVDVIHPGQFRTRPCPGYAGIDLAVRPGRQMARQLDAFAPRGHAHCHRRAAGLGRARLLPAGAAGLHHRLSHQVSRNPARRAESTAELGLCAVPALSQAVVGRAWCPPRACCACCRRAVFATCAAGPTAWTPVRCSRCSPSRRCTSPGPAATPGFAVRGRVSYEKNIEAFLQLDFPGTKVVCGVGPLEPNCASVSRRALAGPAAARGTGRVYAAADVFVFPSRSETFGLVMLEAMACGTPVAAYPVDGPLEVLGQPACQGGALHEDLQQACFATLAVPRHATRHGPARSQLFQLGRSHPSCSPATWCRCHRPVMKRRNNCHESVIARDMLSSSTLPSRS
jgi:hypothetical protein